MKRHERVGEVVALLAPQLPSLSLSELRAVVDRVAPEKALYWLQEHVVEHSDALTSGSAKLPMAMFRLLTELESEGCTEVVVPPCASCEKRRVLRFTNGEGARICQMCKARSDRTSVQSLREDRTSQRPRRRRRHLPELLRQRPRTA